jgi:hypothetical protein
MRPYVVLRYCSAEAWTRGPSAAVADGPALENASSEVAYDVRISDLVLDGEPLYHFKEVGPLGSRERRDLEPGVPAQTCSLTKIISRDVVKHILAGEPPVTRWPLRITYRNEHGQGYATCCVILVVRLPLELCSAVVPCPEQATGDSECTNRA